MPKNNPEYDRHKKRTARRQSDISRAGRDIGRIPPVQNPNRKARALRSFAAFCREYFPAAFYLEWSPDHHKVIAKIETAVLDGGLFAVAMPRGSGKTLLAECACLWAVLIGAHAFVCLIGSSESHAVERLASIKTELETNPALLEDFPEVCYPIRALEGISQRAHGQLHLGVRTHIGWTSNEIRLPTIAGSPASGAILKVAGLTGQIRGMAHKRPDGRIVRPSLVIPDDPQTDESARSETQCETRERILAGAVLGLAGPGKKISGIMPCTVIAPGDVADNILDREKHPEWHGERTKLVYEWPENQKLWDQYAEIRAADLEADGDGSTATEFYREHREEMDAGARVAWPERHRSDELSALQHAVNLKLQDPVAFAAEYQNEPIDETVDADLPSVDEIRRKTNGYRRRVIPAAATTLTCHVDVHAKLLYYTVAAWTEGFTGWVVDYGAYPDQKIRYFTMRDARRTLGRAHPGMGQEAAILAGLTRLVDDLCGKPWHTETGADLHIARLLIDANWSDSTDIVYDYCRQSPHAAILRPAHGRYIGASSKPMHEWKRQRGDLVGLNWRSPRPERRSIRHIVFDTNFWKSSIMARFKTAPGDPGCLTLFEGDHRRFAEHQRAEYRVETFGRGRTVHEWKEYPHRPDNHWFDNMVGCAVGASMEGIRLLGEEPKRKRRSFSAEDLRRGRRAG